MKPRILNTAILEEAHSLNKEQFSLMVEGVEDSALLLLDQNGTIQTWNAGAERISKYSRAEAVGSSFALLYSQEDQFTGEPAIHLVRAAREGKYAGEGVRRRKDGTLFRAAFVLACLKDTQDVVTSFFSVTRDLTIRTGVGEEGELFRLMVEAIEDQAIFAIDPTGVVRTWNRGAALIHGYASDEIIGKHFSVLYPPAALAAGVPETDLDNTILTGKSEQEGWRLRKDGTGFQASARITELRDEAGDLAGLSIVTRDLTKL